MSTNATNRSQKNDTYARQGDRNWWSWLRLILLGMALAGVTGVVMVLPLLPTGRVVLEEGDIALQNVSAPRSATYESDIRYAAAQDRAAEAVDPVYTLPNPALARQQLDRVHVVLDYLTAVRADTLASAAQQRGWIMQAPELADLDLETLDGLLALSDASWDRVQVEVRDVIDQAMRREIRDGYLEDALDRVPALVSLDLSDEETFTTVTLGQRFLISNSSLNPAATAEAQARALLPIGSSAASGTYFQPETPLREMLEAVERDLITRALGFRDGHVTKTAADLGLERSHLYKKMRALGIHKPGVE